MGRSDTVLSHTKASAVISDLLSQKIIERTPMNLGEKNILPSSLDTVFYKFVIFLFKDGSLHTATTANTLGTENKITDNLKVMVSNVAERYLN